MKITMIMGKLNDGFVGYWVNDFSFAGIGDYVIVEKNGGYALAEVMGEITTTKDFAKRNLKNEYVSGLPKVVQDVDFHPKRQREPEEV